MTRTTISEYLAEHPRMMGVLFTVGVLLVQASAVAANADVSNNGP